MLESKFQINVCGSNIKFTKFSTKMYYFLGSKWPTQNFEVSGRLQFAAAEVPFHISCGRIGRPSMCDLMTQWVSGISVTCYQQVIFMIWAPCTYLPHKLWKVATCQMNISAMTLQCQMHKNASSLTKMNAKGLLWCFGASSSGWFWLTDFSDIDSNFPHLGFWSLYPSLSVCGWHKLGFHFSANYEIAAVCGLYVALWHHIYFLEYCIIYIFRQTMK